jgi:ActR/RegA family two-component response regulator
VTGPQPERALVCCVDADGPTTARLRRLAARTGAFVIGDDAAAAHVRVVGLTDHDGSGVHRLQRATRRSPGVRSVVIAEGTAWFEAAFEAGADAWIDRDADDDTVLVAITGRLPARSARRGGRRPRRGLSLASLPLRGT